MRKNIAIFALLMGVSIASAQTMKIHLSDGTTATYPAERVNYVEFIEDDTPGDNGHEYVDLGLPSGLLWATCNVGANSPEEYGDYFAWGETEPYYQAGYSQESPCEHWRDGKSRYYWSSYKWCNGTYTSMTKYCTDSDYGTVDNKTVLELADDAARANWGGSWRMPTTEEQDELIGKCSWTWTTQNGVNGYNVVGPNGNSIFLPAAGIRNNSSLDYAGSYGIYWSSSLRAGSPDFAYNLDFVSGYVGWYSSDRYRGLSVRPVRCFSE